MAASGSNRPARAIQFVGTIQGHPARILVDYGSTHSFVSQTLASQLSGVSTFSPALQVTVADGSQVTCCSQIAQLSWSVQQCDFVSAAKILPLSSYELIVGMDWLVSHSPMQVDWHKKWMLIPYGQGHSCLQGELMSLPTGSVI